MTQNQTAWGRYGRGMTASWLAVLTAAFSHTAAGAALPHPVLILAVLLISGPIGVLLAGRRRSLFSLAAVVTGAQLLFHGLFTLFPLHLGELTTVASSTAANTASNTASNAGGVSSPAPHGQHHHSLGHADAAMPGAPGAPMEHAAGWHEGAWHEGVLHEAGLVMILAHLLAAAMTLFGLRYGELAVARALELLDLRAVLRIIRAEPRRLRPVTRLPVCTEYAPIIGRLLRGVLKLRGPPAVTA